MTSASAMTLTLLIFIVLFLAAIYVILGGGTMFARRERPKSPRQHYTEDDHRRAA